MNVLKEKLFISVDQRKSAAEIGKRTDEFSIVLFSHRAVFIAVVVFGSRAVFSGAGHMANLRHQVMMPSCLAELKGEAVISNSPGRTGTVSGHGEHIAELVSVQGGDIPGAGFGTKKGPPLCALRALCGHLVVSCASVAGVCLRLSCWASPCPAGFGTAAASASN